MLNTIESFSTELWCEIFEFFDAIELYGTFDDINSTITSILSEITPLYCNITTVKDYDFISDVILRKVKNRSNIKSIKFDREFQIEEFFTRWPLNTFQQLRCLSLFYLGELECDCSMVLLEQLSHLTSFESLLIRIGRIAYYGQHLKRLLQLLFIENHAFPILKQFVIQCDEKDRLLRIPITMKQTKLQWITLPSLYLTNLLQLLPSIPYIKFIEVNRLYADPHRTIPVPLFLSQFILWNCVHLNLHLDYHIIFEDIKLLLQKVPKLKQMKLTCDYVLSNGNQWEILLTEKCSHLCTFQISFALQYHFFNRPIFDEVLKSFSTLFWLDRNVKIEHKEEIPCSIIRFKRCEC